MSKILVTGGCGYIGSHTIIDLVENGFDIVSVDSNICSNASVLDAVEKITGKKIPNYVVDICQLENFQNVFNEHQDIVGVIHFAAFKSVPESVKEPLKYYHNNINGLLNTLTCVEQFNIKSFIFSSSCSVYGNATDLPVKETTPMGKAESPYACTKQMSEQIIQDFSVAHPNIKSILLRYFNPGGSHPSNMIGETPQKDVYSVIPILMESLLGLRQPFVVTGNDHDTPDGSCVRDYIHVMDVANAHTKALQYVLQQKGSNNCEVFNIGIGNGVSVLELITAFNQVTGQELLYSIGTRRAGDISAIYADATKAKEQLGWVPKYNVRDILSTTWNWYTKEYRFKLM